MRDRIDTLMRTTRMAWNIGRQENTMAMNETRSNPSEDRQRLWVVAQVGGRDRLVRASSGPEAKRFITEQIFSVRLASQADLERLIGAGVRPENARRLVVNVGDNGDAGTP